jgi:hypothetical protein
VVEVAADGTVGTTGQTGVGVLAIELLVTARGMATVTGTITTALGTGSCPGSLLTEDERGGSVGESYTLNCRIGEDLY